jgi:hypothetical protein
MTMLYMPAMFSVMVPDSLMFYFTLAATSRQVLEVMLEEKGRIG